MASNIESLPAEISLLILENHIANPNDLSALIHASPVQYNVYRQHETAILAAVLRRAIHPSLMNLAIRAVLAKSASSRVIVTEIEELLQWYRDRGHKFCFEDDEIARGEDPNDGEDIRKAKILARIMDRCDMNYDQLVPTNIATESLKKGKARSGTENMGIKEKFARALHSWRSEKFLRPYPDTFRELEILQDSMVLKQLCQLWRIVDFFVLKYVQAARIQQKLIQATNPWSYSGTDWECIKIPRKLSEVEYSRIQRALIYFEMHRRFFDSLELETAFSYTFDQSRFYWRRAIIRMADFETVEFYTVYQYILSYAADILERVELHAEEQIKLAASMGCNYAEHDYIGPSSGHFSSLPLFEFKGDPDIILSSVAKLGLPFLKKLSETGIMQKMTILNTLTTVRGGKRHVEPYWYYNRRLGNCRFYGPREEYSINSPSQGFVLQGRCSLNSNNVDYLPVREQGYIFWDDVKKVRNMKEIKYPLSTARRYRSQDMSLEKQLHLHGWAITREALEASLPLAMTESEIITLVDSCDY